MPSQKYGGWMVDANGTRHSFGGMLCKTRQSSIDCAKVESKDHNMRVYVFKRADPCVLVAVCENGAVV
jgi:hypothetical protein